MSQRLIPSVRRIYVDGDTAIALFDAEETARDGKPYRNTYTWYMKMDRGAIVEVIAFFDTIEITDFWTRVKPLIGHQSSARYLNSANVRNLTKM